MRLSLLFLLLAVLGLLVFPGSLEAVEFHYGASMSSDSFRVIDSQQSIFGSAASSSSSSFRLWSAVADLFTSPASSTTFAIKNGFLAYPFVVAPTLSSAIAGTEQVLLLWTSAQAQVGLSISGYRVCQRTSSVGYSCTSVGATTSSTRSGLTGGVPYTFKIQALDGYGYVIAESSEVSATPSAPASNTGSGGGSGGGGGGGGVPIGGTSSLELSGIAYPSAVVHVMRDGLEIGTVQANAQGAFLFAKTGLTSGDAIIGLWATDNSKRRSITWTFAISLPSGSQAKGAGIILPPTISLQSDVVQPGGTLLAQGSSVPGGSILLGFLPARNEQSTPVGLDGLWKFSLPGSQFELGEYYIKARTRIPPGQDKSEWSQLVPFTIGFAKPGSQCEQGPDVNNDGRVDLIDFSILAYWWDKSVSTGATYDLNCDDRVTLADFSILAYSWNE